MSHREYLKLDKRKKTDRFIAEIINDIYNTMVEDSEDLISLGAGTLPNVNFNTKIELRQEVRKDMLSELTKYLRRKASEETNKKYLKSRTIK